MNDKEMKVREAARYFYDCRARVERMSMANTPLDPDEKRAAFEALEMAKAEDMRAYFALLSAKANYAQ